MWGEGCPAGGVEWRGGGGGRAEGNVRRLDRDWSFQLLPLVFSSFLSSVIVCVCVCWAQSVFGHVEKCEDRKELDRRGGSGGRR